MSAASRGAGCTRPQCSFGLLSGVSGAERSQLHPATLTSSRLGCRGRRSIRHHSSRAGTGWLPAEPGSRLCRVCQGQGFAAICSRSIFTHCGLSHATASLPSKQRCPAAGPGFIIAPSRNSCRWSLLLVAACTELGDGGKGEWEEFGRGALNVPARTGPDAGCRLSLETVPLIKS